MNRNFVACTALALLEVVPSSAVAQDRCAGSRDLRLTNGRIVTMDARNTIVSEVTIQDGRFETVGRGGNARLSPCTKTIDLRGYDRLLLVGPCIHYECDLQAKDRILDLATLLNVAYLQGATALAVSSIQRTKDPEPMTSSST